MNKETYKVNDEIKAKSVKLIEVEGYDIVSLSEALDMAEEAGVDLVAMNDSKVPVCKLMNYSKFLYNKEKTMKKNKKKGPAVKEIRMNPFIAENDIKVKAKTADRILKDGDKLKLTIRFNGRAKMQIGTGSDRLDNFIHYISHPFVIDKKAEVIGNSVYMMISPKK